MLEFAAGHGRWQHLALEERFEVLAIGHPGDAFEVLEEVLLLLLDVGLAPTWLVDVVVGHAQ